MTGVRQAPAPRRRLPPMHAGADAAAPAAQAMVLVVNSGSSSLKFSVYRVRSDGLQIFMQGVAESVGTPSARFTASSLPAGQVLVSETAGLADQQQAVARIARLLDETGLPAPAVIGHRIVHGGPTLRTHCIIDASVMTALDAAVVFAPLHAPAALAAVRFAQVHFPGATQVACLDTAFHACLPEHARSLPLPKALRAAGIVRYGFHGLSCESILHQLRMPVGGPASARASEAVCGEEVPERIVIAHLGNGASVTAVRHGKSVDTSMGLTPSGGVIMGTRSGDLDPGILIYLLREKNFDAGMLEELVDHQSGLRGISGTESDMRRLHQLAAADGAARLAIDMFCHAVGKQIAAMIAVLDGVDLLVFTGGIGEHDHLVRAAVCCRLAWIGAHLDAARNRSAENPLDAPGSRCAIRVLTSAEDDQIARHAAALAALAARPDGPP